MDSTGANGNAGKRGYSGEPKDGYSQDQNHDPDVDGNPYPSDAWAFGGGAGANNNREPSEGYKITAEGEATDLDQRRTSSNQAQQNDSLINKKQKQTDSLSDFSDDIGMGDQILDSGLT